jgi:hypothetical protein
LDYIVAIMLLKKKTGARGERGKMILSGEMIPLNDDRMVSAI